MQLCHRRVLRRVAELSSALRVRIGKLHLILLLDVSILNHEGALTLESSQSHSLRQRSLIDLILVRRAAGNHHSALIFCILLLNFHPGLCTISLIYLKAASARCVTLHDHSHVIVAT